MENKPPLFRLPIEWFIGWIILVSISSAQEKQSADSVFVDEPAAHALYDKMMQSMRDAETLYYESEYEFGTTQQVVGHVKYKMWMKKPKYARLEAESFMADRKGIFIADESHAWIFWPTGCPFFSAGNQDDHEGLPLNKYMKDPPGYWSIAHQTQRLGVGMAMTAIDPSIFHGYTDVLQPYLDGVRSLGEEKVEEEECDVIEVSFMSHQRSWYLWLSKQDHLPRKLKDLVRVSQEVFVRELWSNVRLNDEVPSEKFVWAPPEDWVEYKEQTLEDGLLKPGTKAPDFDLVLIDGNSFALSEQRGKVVWIVFWRVGCPACREEMLHIQQIWKEYKDKELVVVGFNCMDDKHIALDFLNENGLLFSNIVDSSEGANRIYSEDYQTLEGKSAVPLTYIIDKEGKVAGAFYGYQNGDKRGTEILEDLGME